jgi:hypothetical protein
VLAFCENRSRDFFVRLQISVSVPEFSEEILAAPLGLLANNACLILLPRGRLKLALGDRSGGLVKAKLFLELFAQDLFDLNPQLGNILGDRLPNDVQIEGEIGVYDLIAKSTNFSPWNRRVFVLKSVGDLSPGFAYYRQFMQQRALKQLVIIEILAGFLSDKTLNGFCTRDNVQKEQAVIPHRPTRRAAERNL